MADIPTVKLEGKSVNELLAAGIRAYLIGNYNSSVQYLSKAAELGVAANGEKHESLGEIYLFYGKALLEISREDGDPLGDAVPKDVAFEEIEEEDLENEEDEEQQEPAEGGDTVEQNAPEEAKSDLNKEVEGSSKGVEFNGEGEPIKSAEKDASKSETETDEQMEEGVEEEEIGDEVEDEEDDDKENPEEDASGEKPEEDPSDLQLAWEVLELAKMIFQEKGEPMKDELAQTLIALGEVSLESENFESAVNDIKEGLEIQKTLYDDTNRKLAETYYKLGMALATNNQIDEAVENFNITLKLLNNRIGKLENSEKGSEIDEVMEMKALIPEIEEKISDMKNYKEELAKELVETKSTPSSPEKKVTDISHLVKRKRKSLDESEGSSSPAKKPALSP